MVRAGLDWPGSPDCKASALNTGPNCLPVESLSWESRDFSPSSRFRTQYVGPSLLSDIDLPPGAPIYRHFITNGYMKKSVLGRKMAKTYCGCYGTYLEFAIGQTNTHMPKERAKPEMHEKSMCGSRYLNPLIFFGTNISLTAG